MVVLSASDMDSTRPPRRTSSGTSFTASRSSTGAAASSSSSTSRYSVPPTFGNVRITQSVDRDYTTTSGSTSTAATASSRTTRTADGHHRASSTSRSRGTSPASLASPSTYAPPTSSVSVNSSITPQTFRRRYSLSSASTSTGRHGLDYQTVREIDKELDRRKSTSSAASWSRRNDVIYTADAARSGAGGGHRDSNTTVRARSRSTSRRRELFTDDDVNFRTNGYGGVGGVSTTLTADLDDNDDAVSRRVRMALARSSRSRSRAASLTRVETTATASAAAQAQINQLRAAGGSNIGVSASSGTRRASIAGFRASSLTRSPSDVYYSTNVSGAGSQASNSTGKRSVRFEGVEDASGWDLTSFVLNPGERFVPTDVSVSMLPSGKKAVTYTRFSQEGHGDQTAANVEIERVIQRTKRMQDSMHTLENFVKRNRSLFPEDIIIYQRIVFYLLDASELKRLGMDPNQEVYGVKIRERLVAPHGTNVASILKRYYSRHTEVEVEYLETEDIRRRLREEMAAGEAEEEEESSRKRRQYRTDIEETTETELETRRNRVRNKAPSVERRPRPEDRKLIANEDQLIQERTRFVEDSGPQFTSRLQPRRVRTGNTIRLTCNVTGNPEPTVTWYRGNQEIVGNGRFNINNTFGLCTLKIIDARLEDTGVYTARAVNRIGEMSTSAELYVEVNEDFEANREEATRKPWFLIDAQNTWAEVGQRAVIEAQATGRPLPKFKWQKDNVDVQLDLRVRSVSDELGNIKLVIRDVKPSDAGVYFCIAENSEGRAKSAATLRVVNPDDPSSDRRHAYSSETGVDWEMNITETWIRQLAAQANQEAEAAKAPPRGRKPTFVEVPPTLIDVNEGDPLTLRCTVDGDPRPVVTWYKGVRELTYSERHRVLAETDTQYMMQCKWTLQTDPGEYTIVASNVCGLAAFTLFVNVLPRIPQEIDFPTDRRKYAGRDYELVKKMKQGKMPPVFIRKLPLEKTVKVGQTLVIRCSIEEAKMRDYLADVDIVIKDRPPTDTESLVPTRAPLVAPDFIVTAADDVVDEVTSPTNDVTQLNNDDVSVTVLKNVVHVTDNYKPDDDVVSTPTEVTSTAESQQPTAVSAEPTADQVAESKPVGETAVVGVAPSSTENRDVTDQTTDDVQQTVADDVIVQPTTEAEVGVEHFEQQQTPVAIPEVHVSPPDDAAAEPENSSAAEPMQQNGDIPTVIITESPSSDSAADEPVPNVDDSAVKQSESDNADVSDSTEQSATSDSNKAGQNDENSVPESLPATAAEPASVEIAKPEVPEADRVAESLPETEPKVTPEELSESKAASEDIPSPSIPATTPEEPAPADVKPNDDAAQVSPSPENLEPDQSNAVEKSDVVSEGNDQASGKSEQPEADPEPAKPAEGTVEVERSTSPANGDTPVSSEASPEKAVTTADVAADAAATATENGITSPQAAETSDVGNVEKKRKVKKTKKTADDTAGDDAAETGDKPKKKSSGKSKTKSKKKEIETETAGAEPPEVEALEEEAQ